MTRRRGSQEERWLGGKVARRKAGWEERGLDER